MNGQHFNSSGSGNGTPTPPSNSSYPASLSSQSSRDPSPHSRELGVSSQYGYVPNYDQKSSPHVLVNNFSNMSSDPTKQQLPAINMQKTQHQFVNSATDRTQSQGFINHASSPNISSYNSMPMSSPYITSGNKFGVSLMQNPSYSAMSTLNPQINNPLQLSNSNQIQTNSPTFDTITCDYKSGSPIVNSKVDDDVCKQFQSPSSPLISSNFLPPHVQNIPSSPSPLNSVSLANSLSPQSDRLKEQQHTNVSNDNTLLSFRSGSMDKLNSLPPTTSSTLELSSSVNISSSSSSTSPRSINNITTSPDSSPSAHVNSPSSNDSSAHSSQDYSSSASHSTNQSSTLPPSLPVSTAVSSVQSGTSAFPPFCAISQNVLPASSLPVYSQSHVGKQQEVNTITTSNQLLFQNRHTDSLASPTVNHSKEKTVAAEPGSGDELGKFVSQESKPVKSALSSYPPKLQQVAYNNSNQFTSSSQTLGQYNQNRHPVTTSFSNVNQSHRTNVIPQQSMPTSNVQSQNNLGQFSQNYQTPNPPSFVSSNMQNKPSSALPPTSYSQHKFPPPNISGQQKPSMIPPIGGLPPSLSYQSMPPNSAYYPDKPPSPSRPPQQMAPSSVASHPQMPPSSVGPHQHMPPTSLGMQNQMVTPPISGRQHQPTQPPTGIRKTLQYPQQNQFQQDPPLPNQYQQYPSQNSPGQFQQVGSGPPYGMNRYLPMSQPHGGAAMDTLTNQFRGANITQDGFNRLWGMDTFDLLKTRDLLPKERVEAPSIRLNPELFDAANCSPELFRCTLTKIPETKSLLDKSRLPLGVLIHPFKDLTQLSVIQCSTIVRCRACRTYINPFVYFVDNKRWKCNLCFRVNELPDEFQFDPMSKTFGDPSRRPEIKSATIEFIAPSEYMVRPPQPAIYLFLFDVSRLGTESGYLDVACQTLLAELDTLPGDARTSVGFITYDSSVHFYSLAEGLSQPHQMVVVDIDDMFLPCPENLLANLSECHDLIKDLLMQLPKQYMESFDTDSALGAALQAAYKLLAPTGGRVTVFQSRLPSAGPGTLVARENPSQRASDNVPHLNPSTDFYKKLALDCSSQQIAVDMFIVNSQYVDVATLSGVSRFSGGCMYHFPLFRAVNSVHVSSLKRSFQRYLTRKIGFESVMRLRCTRGLSIHTFHGNFFVRSTDLLSLPNVNPDAGFGMQVSIDESLSELQNVCFQAALLYTSSKGERRIRVHTLCLPIATNLSDILNSADEQCIIGLLAKMAVDRSIESSLTDAREAFVNVVADILSAYKLTQNSGPSGCLLAPKSLRLIPMYILALLKSVAFRTGQCTRLDDRVFAMCQMKSLPLSQLLQLIYPDLYPVHNLEQQPQVDNSDENPVVVPPQRLHLSSENINTQGVYLLDDGTMILIYVGHNINPSLCQSLFGVPNFTSLPQDMYELSELSTAENERLRDLVFTLQSEKPFDACIQIIRDDSPHRGKFLERLVEDKNEGGTSYYEFLQRIKVLMK